MNSVKIILAFCSLALCFFVAYGCNNAGTQCDAVKYCSDRGACELVKNQATCTCNASFGGAQCEKCADGYKDVNGSCIQMTSCTEPGACPTTNKTVCDDSSGHVVCSCDKGYSEVNGVCTSFCQQSSPCSDATHTAQHKTRCMLDDSGNAVCTCDAGYIILGNDCVQATSCTPTNPCASLQNQTRCIISEGHVVCECDDGYKDDGTGGCKSICVGACPDNNDPHRTKCQVNGTQFTCSCDDANGYIEFQGTCIKQTQCTANSCPDPNSTCQPNPVGNGTIICPCNDNYESANGSCKLKTGQSCPSGNGSDCSSGHCVTNVCCNSACTGNCQVCKQSDNGICKPETSKCGGDCNGGCDSGLGNCIASSCGACHSCGMDNTGTQHNCQVNTSAGGCDPGSSCNSNGDCKKNDLQSCGGSGECLSGLCLGVSGNASICLREGYSASATCSTNGTFGGEADARVNSGQIQVRAVGFLPIGTSDCGYQTATTYTCDLMDVNVNYGSGTTTATSSGVFGVFSPNTLVCGAQCQACSTSGTWSAP